MIINFVGTWMHVRHRNHREILELKDAVHVLFSQRSKAVITRVFVPQIDFFFFFVYFTFLKERKAGEAKDKNDE